MSETRPAGPRARTPASAAPGPGAACAQAGIATLEDLGLLRSGTAKQIDDSTLADAEQGPIVTTLPEESFLSLGAVVRLRHTNPELFAWCR